MIANDISKSIAEALKAKDEIRLSTLRMLSSALNYEKIAKQHELTEEEEIAVVRKEAKKRKDAIAIYEEHKNERSEELKNKEAEELKILQEYLPPEVSSEDLEKEVEVVIKELGATSLTDMGKVIGAVKAKMGGGADGSRIAEIVKTKLAV